MNIVIVEKLNLMGTTMTQKFKSKKQKALFTNLFFSNDKNILYVAVLKKDGTKNLKLIKSIANKKVMILVQLPVLFFLISFISFTSYFFGLV